jgi:ferritin-like protein
MPTQEERLTTLEFDFNQFKAESTTYYQEMAMQVTMSKGLTEDAVKRLMQLRIQVDKRFTSIDQEIAEVKQDLAEVQQNIGDHTMRLERMETMLIQVLARLPEKP